MGTPREDWRRLASYVISARVAAGYRDRRAFATATGITERTLGKLETGQRVAWDTLATIELHVGWKPDSARRVLEGGEPELRKQPEPEPEPPKPPPYQLTEREQNLLHRLREAIISAREEEEPKPRPAGNGHGSLRLAGGEGVPAF